jgi:hypothetical protein
MEIVQILQSVSVIFACLSIVLGVDAWRREYVGKRKIELAEDVLTLFYQARDAISRIRTPWHQKEEGKTRKPGEYETPEQKEHLDRAYVVFERYEREQEIFNKLVVIRYRFMARFGKKTEKPFIDLRVLVGELLFAANQLGTHYWPRQGRATMTEAQLQTHLEQMNKYEGMFWEGAAEKDEIKQKLNTVIEQIEGICSPIIQEESGVGSFLTVPFSKFFRKK